MCRPNFLCCSKVWEFGDVGVQYICLNSTSILQILICKTWVSSRVNMNQFNLIAFFLLKKIWYALIAYIFFFVINYNLIGEFDSTWNSYMFLMNCPLSYMVLDDLYSISWDSNLVLLCLYEKNTLFILYYEKIYFVLREESVVVK